MIPPLAEHEVAPRALAAWRRHLGRDVGSPESLRRRLGAGTLPAAFAATAARRPDAIALGMGEDRATHGELDLAAGRAAACLRRLGVTRGERVVLSAATTLAHVVAYLGLLRIGAVVVPANPAYTVAELTRLVDASGATRALAGGAAIARLSQLCPAIGLDPGDRELTPDVLDSANGDPEPVGELLPDAPALLAFTSGSTGAPKAVPLSHRNLLASIRGVMWAWRWSEDDRLVHALPIAHQHGLGAVHATLLSGSSAVLLPRFDPVELVDAVTEHDATVLFSVPAMYQRLRAETPGLLARLGRLRLMTSGSAPLPPALASVVESATGQLPLERYGSTEAGLCVSNPYDGPRLPGTVGLPLPGIEVAIVDQDREPVPDGTPGEVVVRGPQVFAGYPDEPDRGSFIHDWLRMGDIGLIEPDSGHLRLVGRLKDVIISGGMNVHPGEVEGVLAAVPGVREVAVVGIPSERWGEEVVAFTVVEGAAVDRMMESAREALAPHKQPKRIISVGAIPRDQMGKLDRTALLALDPGTGDGTAI